MGKRRVRPQGFFLALELENGFFTECDRLIERRKLVRKQEWDREQRRRRKKALRLAKAFHIRQKLDRVRSYDPWKVTEDITEDFFGDNTARYTAIKRLDARKQMLIWCLNNLYHYWAFGAPVYGPNSRDNMSFSQQRQLYFEYVAQLNARVQQEEWDREQAKRLARKRRLKDLVKRIRVRAGKPETMTKAERARRDALAQIAVLTRQENSYGEDEE
jgi:hypothetical protein